MQASTTRRRTVLLSASGALAGAQTGKTGTRIHQELIPRQRIVQAWREAPWTPGCHSLAKFELAARGAGMHLVFEQTGIVENDWKHLNEGCPLRPWEPQVSGGLKVLRQAAQVRCATARKLPPSLPKHFEPFQYFPLGIKSA